MKTASGSPQQQQQQSKCSGVLVWEEGGAASTCFGITSTLRASLQLDLAKHAEARVAPANATGVARLTGIGSCVYETTAADGSSAKATHPPACIGLEFVWYAAQAAHLAAAQKQQQHQEATAHSAGGLHVVSRESALAQHQHSRGDLELLHQHSSSPAASEQLSASSASAAATTAPRHPPTSAPAAPATEGRPSVVQRLQDLHAEVSERLEGKDPLWFGKAFAARAEINWSHLCETAGEVVAAAAADLGLKQRPSGEDSSSE